MKKLFYLTIVLLFSLNLAAQQQYNFQIDTKAKKPVWMEPTVSRKIVKQTKPKIPVPDRETNIVNIIDIGTSANVYEFAYNHSALWVDPNLNTVSFYHRFGGDLGGNGGDMGYDISKDGGNTWELMVRNFVYGIMDGSHVNHGIYNPEGNTEPDNAFDVYNLRGIMDNNTGVIYGISSLGDTTNSNQNFDLGGSNKNFTKSGFDITSDGSVFLVTPLKNDAWEYQDSLVITKGVWNETNQDFDYSSSKIEAIIDPELGGVVDVKVAFGADGQTGYISILGNNGMAKQIEGFSNIYPIYWKTTDGGESWEGPEFVQLDGPLGLDCVVNSQLSDEHIWELFGDNPPARTEISYSTAFDHDITVDYHNDLHIAVVIAPTASDPYSIITLSGYMVVWDLRQQNNICCPAQMGRPHTFRGYFGDLTEDNRVQITKNQNGNLVYISWLDSDMEDAEENNMPNIFCRGLDVGIWARTANQSGEDAPTIVTLFSQGMWESYFGTAAKYAITGGGYNQEIIPFVYASVDGADFNAPVEYIYISDFSMNWPGEFIHVDCECGIVSVGKELETAKVFLLSQNSPNPFREKTTFEIELNKKATVELEVFSTDGRMVSGKSYHNLPQGRNVVEFSADNLQSGIYFYTFRAEGQTVSGKMMVY